MKTRQATTRTVEKKVIEGQQDCPDCGERANTRRWQNHDKTGWYVAILCDKCGYYEFIPLVPDV